MLQRNETVETIFGQSEFDLSHRSHGFSAVYLNRPILRASFAALKEFKNRDQTVKIPNDFENR